MIDTKKEQERDELHRAIWAIADELRGSVDGWDFKSYVLGKMFYRYISENIANYINAGEIDAGYTDFDYSKISDEDAEEIRDDLVNSKGFFILPSELFCNVCKNCDNDENLNETLEKVFRNIENSAKGSQSEDNFSGLFDDFDVNSNKLGATVHIGHDAKYIASDMIVVASTAIRDNNPEVIWYREYTTGLQCNALMSYNGPEDQTQGGVTQNVIESYLCSDGLPIGQSPLYQGKDDPSIWNSFKDRDPRLYQTVADSLRIMSALGTNYSAGTSPTGYATKKFLNDEWWEAGSAFCTGILSPADAPCIRYAEVLLNYVEARYEIAQVGGDAFAQSDLDKSINQLRKRQLTQWGKAEAQTMPAVQLNGNSLSVNGVTIDDPARDPEVNPVLWEIRRERRIELIMEGRRGEDLRRWAKFEYLNSEDANGNPTKSFLGAYVNIADYQGMKSKDNNGNRVLFLFDPENPSNQDTDKGYINYLRGDDLRIFKKGELDSERYYLRAIPAEQITVYKDKGYTLTQNPGW